MQKQQQQTSKGVNKADVEEPPTSTSKSDYSALPTSVHVLEDGLVLIKGAVSPEAQREMARKIMQTGNDPDVGFWERDENGDVALNSTSTRGRIYRPISWYADEFLELCNGLVRTARDADNTMPDMEPTHLMVLYYSSRNGMGFHRDNGENDGTGEQPVVSISLGNACDFAYKHERDGPATVVRLESGDAILFGGRCRMILHSVRKVHRGTSPEWLASTVPDARLNLTFRCAPEAIGREETDFRYFKPGRSSASKKSSRG